MILSYNQATAQQYFQGRNIIISEPVYNDVYVTAGRVVINAPVHGDLVVLGGTIQVNDTVYNDILLLAGDIELKGYAGDDLRCLGGKLTIKQNIKGDILLAGGEIIIDSSVSVGNIAGSVRKIAINGNVSGDVNAACGTFILNGSVEGSIDCRGDNITINGTLNKGGVLAANTIAIGPAAWFGKEIRYWNKSGRLRSNNPFIHSGSVYLPSLRIKEDKWYYLGNSSMLSLLVYLAMISTLLSAIQFTFSSILITATHIVLGKPVKVFLNGLLCLVGIPFLCVLAILSIVGIPLALIVMVLYSLVALCSVSILSLFVSNRMNERYGYGWDSKIKILAAIGIFIVIKLVTMIPVAGYILVGIGVCYCFGAIALAITQGKSHQ